MPNMASGLRSLVKNANRLKKKKKQITDHYQEKNLKTKNTTSNSQGKEKPALGFLRS